MFFFLLFLLGESLPCSSLQFWHPAFSVPGTFCGLEKIVREKYEVLTVKIAASNVFHK